MGRRLEQAVPSGAAAAESSLDGGRRGSLVVRRLNVPGGFAASDVAADHRERRRVAFAQLPVEVVEASAAGEVLSTKVADERELGAEQVVSFVAVAAIVQPRIGVGCTFVAFPANSAAQRDVTFAVADFEVDHVRLHLALPLLLVGCLGREALALLLVFSFTRL